MMTCVRPIVAAAGLMIATLSSLPATAASQPLCRQALALGLDVSGSVDAREYRLQLDGVASALGDADVADALLAQPGLPVRLAIYEWSEPGDERLVLPWTDINSPADIVEIQVRLNTTERGDMGPSTGIGSALRTGFALLAQQDSCWVRTLDISGDGKGNTGQLPQDVTNMPPGVTVNALVIGVDGSVTATNRNLQIGELTAYYKTNVLRGPDAFVETALSFDAYAEAMRRKLLRELATIVLGDLADQ